MTGFLLLFLLGIWIALLWLIVRLMMKFIKPRRLAIAVSVIFSIFFMCLPVSDEIIGSYQFKELCKKEAILKVNEEKSRNRVVFLQDIPEVLLDGYLLPIRKQTWSYLDVGSRNIVVSWNAYNANGGKLIRTLGISETDSPLIFNGVCFPKGFQDIFKKLNITKKQRSEIYDINK